MTRLVFLLAIISVALIATIAAPACFATTWYVDLNGSDSNAGTQAAPFKTPYKAVSVVAAGDTIDIDGGTYMLENAEAPYAGNPVNIATSGTASAPITIQSTPGQAAVIDGTGLTLGTTDAIDLDANYIVIQNLTVQNAPTEGIYFADGNDDIVQNCVVTDSGWDGIAIGEWANPNEMSYDQILGCYVHDNAQATGSSGSGIFIGSCQHCNIQNNSVYHNLESGIAAGPAVQGGSMPDANNSVRGNTICDNNNPQLSIDSVQGFLIEGNLISVDEYGILTSGVPPVGMQFFNESTTAPCANCRILNNIVANGADDIWLVGAQSWSTAGGFSNFSVCNNIFYTAYYGCVAIDYDANNSLTFCNNIVWQPNSSGVLSWYTANNLPSVISNNCWDGTVSNAMAGGGDIDLADVDPGFMGSGGFIPKDYTLEPSSPCISAGINEYSIDPTDFNGVPMPSSSAWNMGPFAPAAAPANNGGTLLPAGYLSTNGNQIVDSSGDPVRIASVGWIGILDVDSAPLGLWSVNYKTTMNAMVADGFNCIRFTWSNGSYHCADTVLQGMDYTQNADLVGLTQMQVLDKIVAYAGQIGLKIILDHHVDEGASNNDGQQANGLWIDEGPGTDGTDGAGNPGTVTAQVFQNDWVGMAERYAGNPTVIGCDLDNEPVEGGGGTGWGCNWGQGGPVDVLNMYETVGNAILAANPNLLIICEGPINVVSANTSPLWLTEDLTHVATQPVVLNTPNRLVYSTHEYPNEVAATIDDSGPVYFNRLNTDWGYIYNQNIAPIWVGEMGEALTPTDSDGNTWIASLIPYLDDLDGVGGGPAYNPADEPISTSWWFWGTFNDSDPWSNGTLLDWNPPTFNPCNTAATDDLLWAQPQIASLSETSGKPGDAVRITGSGYYAIKSVAFDGVPAAYTATGPMSIVATAPATGKSGTVTVTTSAGKAVSPSPFSYINPTVSSVVLSPTKVVGSASSTATVTLSSEAFGSGTVVTIKSSNPLVATVAGTTITIPAGSNLAQFTIISVPVAATATATISATAKGVTKSAVLTVQAPAMQTIGITPLSLIGGLSATATVTLTGPTAQNTPVALASNSASAVVPASTTVNAGQNSSTFAVSTKIVSDTTTAVISATLGGVTRKFTITIKPLAVATLTLAPATVVGGSPSMGTVTLNAPAAANFNVSLGAAAPASVAGSVTVLAGNNSATFPIATTTVTARTTSTISASAGGVTKKATLTVKP